MIVRYKLVNKLYDKHHASSRLFANRQIALLLK